MLKLIGGAAIALVLAAAPGFVTGKRLVADALLIALAANLGNLLDRVPGRAVARAVFLCGAVPAVRPLLAFWNLKPPVATLVFR